LPTPDCVDARRKAADAQAKVEEAWDDLKAAGVAAGIGAGATGAIFGKILIKWILSKILELAAGATVPLLGWIFVGITAALAAAVLVLYFIWRNAKVARREACREVRTKCDIGDWGSCG